jgi:hypothetical protein
MPVLQRFYPEFFFQATHKPILGVQSNVSCKVALFGTGSTFNSNLGMLALSQQIPGIISGTTKDITLNVTRSGLKILFSVPEINWSGLSNSVFKHVIIWIENGNLKGGFRIPLMHFDLGVSTFPDEGGTFIFTPSEICIPNIDLDYKVCS